MWRGVDVEERVKSSGSVAAKRWGEDGHVKPESFDCPAPAFSFRSPGGIQQMDQLQKSGICFFIFYLFSVRDDLSIAI